jgi:hypothetical protein
LLFRNRGYLMRRHRRWGFFALDVLRYGAFFLLRRRPDLSGYLDWMRLTWRGAAERLGAPSDHRDGSHHAPARTQMTEEGAGGPGTERLDRE